MPLERPAPYRLTLLGPWDLRGPDGEKVRSVVSQPKRLCLLAYLALSGEPVSRSTLVALFWPESDEDRARNALSQALHYLRRSLGPRTIESVEGDRLMVRPERVWFDARILLASGGQGARPPEGPLDGASAEELSKIVEPVLRGREFFEGWNAEDSQPLQEWLDRVRGQVKERGTALGAVSPGVAASPATAEGQRSDDRDRVERPRRLAWIGAGLLLGALLPWGVSRADFMANADAHPAEPAAMGDAPVVAVLLPRVTAVGSETGVSTTALAEAVHEELLAEMWSLAGVRVLPVSFESDVRRLVRSLEAQGTDRMPDWVVSVRIRTGGGSARVVAWLWSGPDFGEIRELSEMELPVVGPAEGLIRMPAEIAAAVVEELMAGVGFAAANAPGG